jgi:hypothetical protein
MECNESKKAGYLWKTPPHCQIVHYKFPGIAWCQIKEYVMPKVAGFCAQVGTYPNPHS